jgi:hypothetical protein
VRLLEGDQLRLTRSTNELLSGERGIADERLKRALNPRPQIYDVGGEIFGGARRFEMSQNGSRAIERGECRL